MVELYVPALAQLVLLVAPMIFVKKYTVCRCCVTVGCHFTFFFFGYFSVKNFSLVTHDMSFHF